MIHTHSLDGPWVARPLTPAPIPSVGIEAPIPGTIHTALIRAGIIDHPNLGTAERDQPWVGETDWEFARDFTATPGLLAHDRVDLCLDGLDTIASLELNGRPIGSAANAFHEHRFDVRSALLPGVNRLTIAFTSPLRHIRAERDRLGARPVNGDWEPFNLIRKPACNFGWDWGPRIPTCGIWRSARLEAWSGRRLVGVRILTPRADEALAHLDIFARLDGPPHPDAAAPELILRARLIHDGRVIESTAPIASSAPRCSIEIAHPRLWYPVGHGEQALHALTVELLGDGRVLDSRVFRIGLRRAELLTAPDAAGARFALRVNGREVFAQGANWIPDTLFPEEFTPQRARQRLTRARDAGFNAIRVWGGGLYEPSFFYGLCDELGLLVWQDFMFACALYPEEPPFPGLVEAEARAIVERLSPHPSVVLYCGGNECVWGYQRWGWKERLLPGQTWGIWYWTDLLPRVLAELDPTRPYWPNSPWSGSVDTDVLDPDRGDRHTWDAAIDGYRDLVPRLVSEFGHQSPASAASWRGAIAGPEPLAADSPASIHRQRATGGNAAMYGRFLPDWWGERVAELPFEVWVYAAQVVQARAIEIAFSWARIHRPRCMGALVWQLNDGWVGHSWSLIDGAGREKPAYFAARRACRPRALSIHPVDGRLALFAVNDTDEAWRGEVALHRIAFDGEAFAAASLGVDLAPRTAARVAPDLAGLIGAARDPTAELVEARAGDAAVRYFHLRDRFLRYPEPGWSAWIAPGGSRLRLTARTLLRDIVIALPGLSDQLLTLLPGEKAMLDIDPPISGLSAADLAPPMLLCAGHVAR